MIWTRVAAVLPVLYFQNLIFPWVSWCFCPLCYPGSFRGRHYSHCPSSTNKTPLPLRPPSHRTCRMWYSPTEAYSSLMKESVSDAAAEDVSLLTELFLSTFFGKEVVVRTKIISGGSKLGWKLMLRFHNRSRNLIGFIERTRKQQDPGEELCPSAERDWMWVFCAQRAAGLNPRGSRKV